jgi:hypothetical protein
MVWWVVIRRTTKTNRALPWVRRRDATLAQSSEALLAILFPWPVHLSWSHFNPKWIYVDLQTANTTKNVPTIHPMLVSFSILMHISIVHKILVPIVNLTPLTFIQFGSFGRFYKWFLSRFSSLPPFNALFLHDDGFVNKFLFTTKIKVSFQFN